VTDRKKQKAKPSDQPEWFAWNVSSVSDCRRLETIALLLEHDERLLTFLFDFKCPRLRKNSDQLIAEAHDFSASELLLIRTTIDIWKGGEDAVIEQPLNTCDRDAMVRFIRAHSKKFETKSCTRLLTMKKNGVFCL
jgi:hypothetical protein